MRRIYFKKAAYGCAFTALAIYLGAQSDPASRLFAAAVLILSAAALFFLKEGVSVSRIYAVLYLLLAAFYLFALPLFHVSDEQQHFLRAYTIASGRLLPEKIAEKEVGACLPGNLIPEALEKAGEISWRDLRGALEEKLEASAPKAYSFPCAALYSPVSYLPQALGIRIAGWFTQSPVLIAYAGRGSNLLAVLLLTYLALKWMPFGKETMLLLLLAPIQMHKAASLSADGFTLAIVVLLFAYTLYLQYGRREKLRRREIALLYLLAFLVSQCKIVYVPACFLLFILSPERFGSRRRYLFHAICIGVLTAAASLGWLFLSSELLTAAFPDSGEQIRYLLRHPAVFAEVLFRTLGKQAPALAGEMIGWRMGLGTVYNSRVLIFGYLALLLLTAVLGKRETLCVAVNCRDKWLGACAACAMALLICTALYVQWTDVAAPVIYGLQGRYFLPPLAMLLLALLETKGLDRLRRKLDAKLVLTFAVGVNLAAVVTCFQYGLSVA